MVSYNQAVLVACRYITNESCFLIVILAETRMSGTCMPLLSVQWSLLDKRASLLGRSVWIPVRQVGGQEVCRMVVCVLSRPVWFDSPLVSWWEVINLTRALHSCCGGACTCVCVCVRERMCQDETCKHTTWGTSEGESGRLTRTKPVQKQSRWKSDFSEKIWSSNFKRLIISINRD